MNHTMTRATCRVGERGEVTIPEQIREKADIHGGDEVVIDREDGKIIIRKVESDEELADAYDEHAERAREVNDEWKHASTEASENL